MSFLYVFLKPDIFRGGKPKLGWFLILFFSTSLLSRLVEAVHLATFLGEDAEQEVA